MSRSRNVVLLLVIMGAIGAWSVLCFRAEYTNSKRLRMVEPGKFYRCGQLTESGIRSAVRELGIRTVINVQEDVPDPAVWRGFFNRSTTRESAVCKDLNVRYVWLTPDVLPSDESERRQPEIINHFLEVLDDPSAYPVLLHCKAGLHRTGVLSAVYRMEYQGWSRQSAFRELRAHGFGDWVSTTANPYIEQYIFRYKPRTDGATQRSHVRANPDR